MANQDDVRRIAMALPGASERPERFAFFVLNKDRARDFAWVWGERIDPKKARVPQPAVLAVRVANEEAKQFLIGAMPDIFFTEPHYNGFPAVLVRLAAVQPDTLASLILDAWRLQAPRELLAELDTRSADP